PLGADDGAGHRRGERADPLFRGRGEPGRGADPARRLRSARTYPLRRPCRGGAVLLGERLGRPAALLRDGDRAARTRTAPVIPDARNSLAAVPTESLAPLRPVVLEGLRRWARPATAGGTTARRRARACGRRPLRSRWGAAPARWSAGRRRTARRTRPRRAAPRRGTVRCRHDRRGCCRRRERRASPPGRRP